MNLLLVPDEDASGDEAGLAFSPPLSGESLVTSCLSLSLFPVLSFIIDFFHLLSSPQFEVVFFHCHCAFFFGRKFGLSDVLKTPRLCKIVPSYFPFLSKFRCIRVIESIVHALISFQTKSCFDHDPLSFYSFLCSTFNSAHYNPTIAHFKRLMIY